MESSVSKVILKSRRVVLPEGVRAAVVVLEGERISAVLAPDDVPAGAPVEDLGDDVLMPGLVDTHAHINEPGRTEWEGFETATQACAAGGITTVVDMPLNCIPVTTSRAALATKLRAIEGKAHVDHAFWGGVVPGNAGELAGMIADGVAGFKAFMVHSGIDDFPQAREDDLRRAMPVLAEGRVPLLVHAELECTPPGALAATGDPRAYATYLASRPPAWETEALRTMAGLCRETRCAVHVVHLSAADALDVARRARDEALPFSVETCPHYLLLCAEEVPDGATEFKCAPPVRERENRERLWRALRAGEIDLVVSDHSPCTPALKLPEAGDFMGAWGGIASLQFGLSLIWTEARARGATLADIARWMSRGPAALAGLDGRKGAIRAGLDADLVVFRPEAEQVLRPEMIRHRHKVSPYVGRRVHGVVARTYLRGRVVFEQGELRGAPAGQVLRRASS